jgi:hypothetical protein
MSKRKLETKQIAINTFEDGMSLDVDELLQKANTMAMAMNIRFIARDNTVYVVTNVKGNEVKSLFTPGYIPLAVDNKNGIAYIISAEITGGTATGYGEIGTFPSPDYVGATGAIVNTYAPLQNYSGDIPENPLVYGNFISSKFNFSLRFSLDIELQNSYDGSVNVVFTDGENPMRIINSGFSVLPDRKYIREDHVGLTDSNKYDLDHWKTTIKLIQNSNKIVNLNFEGVDLGGNLKGGNYTYFFKYATQDFNETDIIESSRVVSIFHGDTPGDIQGGLGDGEEVQKSARFTLSNIDQSFAYVVVYFSWTSGLTTPLTQTLRIDNFTPIIGDTIEVIHTGNEATTTINLAELSDDNAKIDTSRTIAQFQGMMFAGNIRTKLTHAQEFLDFSKTIRIGSQPKKLETPDFREIEELKSSRNDQITTIEDGWNNAYYNPKNIHERLGYTGGEAEAFRIVYILPDGSTSDAYPLLGIDHRFGVDGNDSAEQLTAKYNRLIGNTAAFDNMASNNGYYNGTGTNLTDTMVNVNGIYRFPNRTYAGDFMWSKDDETVTINNVWFELPKTIPQEIKDRSIGCFFVKGEKKKDVLSQGVFINTLAIPNYDFWKTEDWSGLLNYNGGVYNDSNSKSIPCYSYIHEFQHRWVLKDASSGWSNADTEDQDAEWTNPAIIYAQFGLAKHLPLNMVDSFYERKFAYYTMDNVSNAETFAGKINNRTVSIDLIGRVVNVYDINTQGEVDPIFADMGYPGKYVDELNNFSLIRPVRQWFQEAGWTTGEGYPIVRPASASIILAGDKKQNLDKFAGGALFSADPYQVYDPGWLPVQRRFIHYSEVKYNSYVGLYLNDAATISLWNEPTETPGTSQDTKQVADTIGDETSSMIYANLYGASGQRNQQAVEDEFGNADNHVFTPITKRMYWDDTILENDPNNLLVDNLIGDSGTDHVRNPVSAGDPDYPDGTTFGRLKAYGGDTYIGQVFRKVFMNALSIDEFNEDDYGPARSNIGYTLAYIQEADANPALRNEEIVDELETDQRSFFPFSLETRAVQDANSWGNGNMFRDDLRLIETAGYNKGYLDSLTKKYYTGINQLSPFTQKNWMSRVWFSGKHIPNSFHNAYRSWGAGSYQDYDSSLGEIVALRVFNNTLYAIQENGIGGIPVNERIETGQDTAGYIFVEAANVLSPFIGQISATIGTKYKESVIATQNGLYGYSEEQTLIWKVGLEDFSNMSDLNIGSYLVKEADNWRTGTSNTYLNNVRSFYDAKNKEVVFSFISQGKSFTVAQFEPLGIFTSFFGYIPEVMFSIYDEMYSGKSNKLWLHDSDNVVRGSFYGAKYNAEIHLIVNDLVLGTKVFENLQLVSNNVKPKIIRYKIQGAETNQVIVYDPDNIHLSNAHYRDEKVMVSIPVVETITDESTNAYYEKIKDNALSLLGSSAKMRGKLIRLELVYDTDKQLRMQSVITIYRRSFS